MKAGLIGYPIAHSLSPQIFSILSRNYNVPLDYDLLEIHPSFFETHIREFPWKSYIGLNVTIPYKNIIRNEMTHMHPDADAIGVINVVKVKNGQKIGYNTDVYGFRKCLEDEGVDVHGMECVIFGTGGAARAAIHVLKDMKAKSVTVISRSPDQLKYLGVCVAGYANTINADLYVNATPLGTRNFHEKEAPYSGVFNPNSVVFDMVYRPQKTVFLQNAENQKVKTIGGLNMLIWQALKTWEIWFDQIVSDARTDVFKYLSSEKSL